MLSIIQCASKILSSSSIAWPPSPPPVYVRVIPVCPADPRGKYTLNESHSLTPTICRLCFIKQNVALDEHVMCIFYYRLKLYYSYRMCPCVNGSSGNVCEREREREAANRRKRANLYILLFLKRRNEKHVQRCWGFLRSKQNADTPWEQISQRFTIYRNKSNYQIANQTGKTYKTKQKSLTSKSYKGGWYFCYFYTNYSHTCKRNDKFRPAKILTKY